MQFQYKYLYPRTISDEDTTYARYLPYTEKELNELGLVGWEIVQVSRFDEDGEIVSCIMRKHLGAV